MRRSLLTLLIVAAAGGVLAAPAAAASWHSYSLWNNAAKVEGGSGTHTVRLTSMILPDNFRVKVNAKRTGMTFGPFAACRSTGTITPTLVASSEKTSSDVLKGLLPPKGTTYGSGTRGNAAWRVAKYSGGSLRAAYVGPTRIAGVWVVVRAATKPTTTCHIGGVRESLGFPLADSFATIRANGF